MTAPSADGDEGDAPQGDGDDWNSDAYDGSHSFVYEYGSDVVDLLNPEPGERVLDLGCGTGHLADRIADAGADVVGVDQSAEMIETAREAYDHRFVRTDARDFDRADLGIDTGDAGDAAGPTDTGSVEPFDAVFSNAALHWIDDQDAVLDSVTDVLRPGGRFVAELGGHGNVSAIVEAVRDEFEARGYAPPTDPWYFPTVGEHATTLEAHGFEVRYARLFDRLTELEEGDDGMAAWLGMFGDRLFDPVPGDERPDVVAGVEDRLRDELYDAETNTWTADYRRLRFVAVLEG